MKAIVSKKWQRFVGVAVLAVLMAGCSTMNVGDAPNLPKTAAWAILPIANTTETPDAGQRAENIAQSIMVQNGFTDLHRYVGDPDGGDSLVGANNAQARVRALDWARKTGAKYALSGAVTEWRYKVGVDGEPVAGVTFDVIDLSNGSVVWSATGSRSGWSRSSLSGVGQTLIRNLLAPLAQP